MTQTDDSLPEDTLAQRVRSVAEAFTITGLARLLVRDTDFELELRRSTPYVAAPLPAAVVAAIAEESVSKKPEIVTSDLVGVLRFSRPYVSEGQALEGDRELAFVEALGIRNPVRSRGAGRVAAVFVSDGQPVEFGQPLFAIER
jgi:acetyl-CoA carboxylase biotin carboxyl carrier protein